MNLWKERNWNPMLLKEQDAPFYSKEYIFEIKFDGIRAILFVSKTNVQIKSRNGLDLTELFPELQEIKKLVHCPTIFDGEIILLLKEKPSFSSLQKRIHLKKKEKIFKEAKQNPVLFIAFDLLYENKNLISHPLLKRKEMLNQYEESDVFIKIKTLDSEGIAFFKQVKKMGLEGIVAKKKNSAYFINQRTDAFIKIKNFQRDSFYIGGYEYKKNDLITLYLGEFKKQIFSFVGKVSLSKKEPLYEKIIKQKKTKNFFSNLDEKIFFIKPLLTCQVKYLERTKENHLRHPVLDK